MYKTILVTLDTTPTDRAIIEHVKELAKFMKSRVVLLHVATSAAAQWHGPNAAGEEVEKGQAYLDGVKAEFAAVGVTASAELAYGAPPARQIVKWVQEHDCDLVAMSTHGHRLLGDLLLGVTASEVQHSIGVPVLLLRAR
ncbi:MAG: universal stress protein [Thermoguttaceae bacterium]|jgi:nucleotide-binding universal stress UspA family protein